MKAIVCHAPEDLRLDALDTDTLGTHQLQVDVAYGGICGSDLHYYHHGGFG
ncbi:MAG: L-idonate 5-dehydrogenase, partial [Betaproteobacteria bacterium]|nr:L-idonate 5-dehydrogenase [Betaproteobacteria bacterium]